MGCVSCGKRGRANKGNRETMSLKCPICNTLLHGRSKDMKTIDGNKVCGECYNKYLKIKKLKKVKKDDKSKTDK